MMNTIFSDTEIILASKSPRRKELLEKLDVKFSIVTKEVDESYPNHIPLNRVAEFIAQKKAEAFGNVELKDKILITADTIVLCDNIILGKPKNTDEAFKILEFLTNKTHEVITGVCLKSASKYNSFSCSTQVSFKRLSKTEINYYIENYMPLDKAGAYGIQEWIGSIGITKIDGSYDNVVGFPLQMLYSELLNFI